MKKRALLLSVLGAFSVLFLVACGGQSTTSDQSVPFKNENIVNVNYLKDHLDDEKVMIVDARGEKKETSGVIKNASVVSWQQFSNMEGTNSDPGFGVVLLADKLGKALSEAGLSKEKTIILYSDSQKEWGEDGSIFWMLQGAGYTDIKILDGGLSYWKAQGGEITNEIKKSEAVEVKVEDLDKLKTINTATLEKELNAVQIIDTREKDKYDGAVKYGEKRGGHIPGAINIPFSTLFNDNGTLKSNNELEKMLTDAGITKDKKVVSYCTAGIRSGYMTVVLEMLGYGDSFNYDDSFYSWAASQSTEVVK